MFSRRDLIKLLGPLIVEQILAVLVGMVDVMMVAAVSESAVSGVALVDSINLLIIQLLSALATGGAVICSQYLGKKKSEMACMAAGQLLLITFCCSILFAGIALLGNRRLLAVIFGAVEDSVMTDAGIYFLITALSYPFLALYNSCAALFRSMNNSRVSMMVSIFMNAINITGNAICIYALHMGVEGVAIPTLVSRMAAAVLILILIQHPANLVRVRKVRELRPDKEMIRRILSVGIPSGMESGMFQFGKIALQSLVSTLGTTSIAAFAVASNLVTLQYLPGNAIGLGLITIVGQCTGAGERQQAKDYTKKLIACNYVILLVICTLMAAGSGVLTGLYSLSPEAARLSRELITTHCFAMVIWPLSFTLPNALRASLDAKFTMTASVLSMWVFRIGAGYLFVSVLGLGVMGIWYGMFIDWSVRSLLFLFRFRGFTARTCKV